MKFLSRAWLMVVATGLFLVFVGGCASSEAPLQATPTSVVHAPIVSTPTPIPLPEVGTRDGDLAPDFMLRDLSGNEVLLSDLRGNVVFLNFWATWCPYCREEMASMERMYQEYKNRGLLVVAVDVGGKGETLEKIEKYVSENNLTFLILVDLRSKTRGPFKVMSIPSTYILDRDGIIRSVVMGARDWDSEENRRIVLDVLEQDHE